LGTDFYSFTIDNARIGSATVPLNAQATFQPRPAGSRERGLMRAKLLLTQSFQASYLVTQNKNNLSALSLKRHLGVAYATAWRFKHKLL